MRLRVFLIPVLVSALTLVSAFFGWAEQGRVVNEEMGIMVSTITEEYKQDLNLDNANGVIVLGVLPGGPADEGGIHPGDIILGIADIAINNLDEYEDAIEKLKGRMDFNIMIRTRDGSFSFIQIISHAE
ncbi:MAG TPA: PDZ domain-containing protein [Nitrospiria bacterium]|nr:PDZ domain-containing protein [Nitrospiria bacterium]